MSDLIIRITETTAPGQLAGTTNSHSNIADRNPNQVTEAEAGQALTDLETYLNGISGRQVDLTHVGIRIGSAAPMSLSNIAGRFTSLASRVDAIRHNVHVQQAPVAQATMPTVSPAPTVAPTLPTGSHDTARPQATPSPTSPNNPLVHGELSVGLGYAHRSADNTRFDGHDGPGLDISLLWPRIELGRNFYFSPGVYFNYQHVSTDIPAEHGPSTTSYANFFSGGVQAYFGWNPSRYFEAGLGLRAGAVHLSSEGTADGSRGFRYSNLVYPSGADATTFDGEFTARIGVPRLFDFGSAGLGIFLNTSVGIPGTNSFQLIPGYDTTRSSDSNIGVATTPWYFGASISVPLGRVAHAPRAAAEETSTTTTVTAAPTPTATATPTPAPTAPLPSPTPAPVTTPAPSYTDSVDFRVAASHQRALTPQRVAALIDGTHISNDLLPSNSRADFTISYTNADRGSINLYSFTQNGEGGSRSVWNAPFTGPGITITPQQVSSLMDALVDQLPKFHRTSSPIHLTVVRDAQGRVSLSSSN